MDVQINPTTLVTSRMQRGPIRVRRIPGRGKAPVTQCDECGHTAQVYATGRDRVGRERTKHEYLCEACIARLSTHDDPFGVMEGA